MKVFFLLNLQFFVGQKYNSTVLIKILRNGNYQCIIFRIYSLFFDFIIINSQYSLELPKQKYKMFYFYLPTHVHSAFVPYQPEIFQKTNNFFFQTQKCSNHLEVFSQESSYCDQSSTDHQVLKENKNNSDQFEKNCEKPSKIYHSKKTEELIDVEYKPNKRATKKTSSSKLNQNRNILPNTIHQLLSFVQRRNRSGKIVERIFSKYIQNQQEPCSNQSSNQMSYSVNRFYIYQKEIKNKIGNYVTEESLKKVCNFVSQSDIFSREEQLFYNKIFRILIISYLQKEGNCSVLLSKRMYSDKKIEHIKVNRQIKDMIKSKFASSQIQSE